MALPKGLFIPQKGKTMTLEDCMKCKHHVRQSSGYVECNYWIHLSQHVINQSGDGSTAVVGCPIDDR
jgi:hypothetical protein